MNKLRSIVGLIISFAASTVLMISHNGGRRGITPEDCFTFEFII